MSRPGRRRSWSILTAALFALALPAAAQGAAYTVDPSAPAGPCAAGTCPTLLAAAAAINAGAGGDTVNVLAGTYDENPTFTKPDVTITGAGQSTLVLGSITFSGSGASPSALKKVAVLRTVDDELGAVIVNASYGFVLEDTLLVSGGNGILITNGDTLILRSTILPGADGNAVDVRNADAQTSPTALDIESSILSGNGGGSGLSVRTGAETDLPLTGGAGDIDVTVRHATIAGSTNSINVDATQSQSLTPTGDISVDVTDSIVLGAVGEHPFLGALIVYPPNTATVTFTGANDITSSAGALFVDPTRRNLHLRADSPAIDQAATAGASPTDADGEPRTSGPASDLGGDEFVNKPPVAKITRTTELPRDGQPVTLSAKGTSDQAGDRIATYVWSFGDGEGATTTVPEVTHTYKGEGPVTAALVAVDLGGLQSAGVSTKFTILDGGAPTVVITKPKNNQKIFQFIRKTKTVIRNGVPKRIRVRTNKRTRIKFAGAAADKSGVARLYLTVQKIANASGQTLVTGGQSATQKCTFLDPKDGLKRVACDKAIVFQVKLKSDGKWAYNVRKSIKMSKGTYRAIVYGVDKAGVLGNAAEKAARNIKFKIR